MTLEKKTQVIEEFGKGLERYTARDFEGALAYFKNALQLDPEDGPSKVYIERSEEYIKTPPPPDWDGVYVMKTK